MEKQFKLTVPVLLVGFNRPDNIQKVFNCIRDAQPEKLYVIVDGARKNKEGEKELVEQTKKVVQKVDWKCNSQFRFNEENRGAEVTVSSGISWVFEENEYAIIIEDDIVAPLAFYRFMQEMLLKYKDHKNIGIVSGVNSTPMELDNDDDYFFAKYGHTWGWGTWRRFWELFDLNIEIKDEHLSKDFLNKISNSKAEARFYRNRFKTMKERGAGNNTWDVVGNYIARTHEFIHIVPRVNLTSNIGVEGLHARGKTKFHFHKYDENFVVKNHPEKIECNTKYDIYHFNTIIKNQRPMYQRIVNKISRILFSKNYYK